MTGLRTALNGLSHDTYGTIYTVPAGFNLVISGVYVSDIEVGMEIKIRIGGTEAIVYRYGDQEKYDAKSFIAVQGDVIEVKHTNGSNNSDITLCGQLVVAS